VTDLLAQRQISHGCFIATATISQELKRIIRRGSLSDVQREALEAIAVKIARILAGDPNHLDHWDDIAGYATLVGMELRKKERAARVIPSSPK
jgi:hypothetical protein